MEDGLKAMRTDMLSYLPGDLLAKVDIVSMAHGLECRSPFLDHLLIEDALKIPFQYLVDSPQELRTRPKMGFRIPLSYWMRGHENKGIQELADPNSFCSQFLNPAAISEMIAKNQSGNWDFGDRLWALLFLERWGRTNF
jgi:asparagine synthase (glutamine-hydrolysing)